MLLNTVLIGVMATIGLGLASGRARGIWSGLTLAWLAAEWWLGQGLGGPGTGVATDPGLAPLLAVLLISAWFGVGPARPSVEVPHQGPQEAVRRALALGGLAALMVGVVPAIAGLPLAAAETTSRTAATTSARVAGGSGTTSQVDPGECEGLGAGIGGARPCSPQSPIQA